MRVIRINPSDDLQYAINSAIAAENLSLGWVLIRSDRCPLVERQQNDGDEPTDEEFEHHCPEHDHIPEYVLMILEERIPTGTAGKMVDSIEMLLASDEFVGHEEVYVPDDEPDDLGNNSLHDDPDPGD